MPPKAFRFTHFPKNASANPLESHTFKTKDLKPFRFTHFQKKGRGGVRAIGARRERRAVPSNLQPRTSNLCSSLSPLDSALTSKRAAKSFTSNTYEKHTHGEGGASSHTCLFASRSPGCQPPSLSLLCYIPRLREVTP